MAARGAEVKEKLTNVLTKLFPESFMDGKILRIPMKENGEIVEIKVTLTAAKDVLGGASTDTFTSNSVTPAYAAYDMPTDEEIEEVKKYLSSMGMI